MPTPVEQSHVGKLLLNLSDQIEVKKEELLKVFVENHGSLASSSIVEVSQELDKLLVQYYHIKMLLLESNVTTRQGIIMNNKNV